MHRTARTPQSRSGSSCLPVQLALCTALLALLLVPARAQAQHESYNFSVGLLGGLGGSLDATPGDKLDNTGYQIDLGMVTQPGTHLVARLGHLGLDSSKQFGDLTNADLTYATIGGEYRYRQSYYDSGVYLALGGYRLSGDDFLGRSTNDTAIGLALGVTGEFDISRHFSVLVEFSGHWADLGQAQVFAMGHAGIGYRF